MNGPSHYAEAERLIEVANHVGHVSEDRGRGVLAAAQVHATLALAAATAIGDRNDVDLTGVEMDAVNGEWGKVLKP